MLVALSLSSCAVLDQGSTAKPLERNAKWALLPIINHTDIPQAGLRAEAIAEVLLRNRGIDNLRRYPPTLNPDSLFEPAERKVVVDALKWAHEQGVRYAVTGAVDEWHYKVGIDGEPAVGLVLQIIDLDGEKRGVECGKRQERLEPRIAECGRAKIDQGHAGRRFFAMTPLVVSRKSLADKVSARLRILLAPANGNHWMWLEVVVIVLCALAIGFFFEGDNPFQIGGEFPWIWLAPVLVALRYGVVPGVGASLILLGAWQLLAYLKPAIGSFPQQFFLGGLILVMLCGEFSTAWSTRLRRAEETDHYLDERLSRITLRHLLLRLSHDRMEQEILTKPVTLRDALLGLRKLTTEQSNSAMPASISLLQFLTQFASWNQHRFPSPPRMEKLMCMSSEIGSPPDLLPDDLLLKHALEHRSLAHLLTEGLADEALPSPILVVAPS